MTSSRLAPHLLLCGLAACFSDPGAGSPTSATESTGGSAFSSDGDTVATTGSTSSPDPSTSTSSSTGDDATSTTTEDTTSTTEPNSTTGGVCGDGIVDPGEECDDGPANADDAPCSSACVSAFCGDGVVQAALNEECDDGPANADNAACTEACEAAKCGDGLIWEGVEECDNEDDNKIGGYGDCTPGDCTWWGDHCGDGVVQKEHEECDLGAEDNEADGNACTKSCKLDGKAIFVTSKSYTGKLGGLSGADDRCNSLALAAGVANAGEFMAWLSTEEESPASRMTHSTQRYVLLDGETIVAESWMKLTDGALDASIDVDETGAVVGSDDVWTGTTPAGQATSSHCLGWTSDDEGDGGTHGLVKANGPDWTEKGAKSCALLTRLICVEQ